MYIETILFLCSIIFACKNIRVPSLNFDGFAVIFSFLVLTL